MDCAIIYKLIAVFLLKDLMSSQGRRQFHQHFLRNISAKRMQKLERVFPEGAHIVHGMYLGDKPMELKELVEEMSCARGTVASKRDEALILLGRKGSFNALAKTAAKLTQEEYQRREILYYLLSNKLEQLCELEKSLARATLEQGFFYERLEEKFGMKKSVIKNILLRMIGQREVRIDEPGPKLRTSMFTKAKSNPELNPKAETELRVLRFYASGRPSQEIGKCLKVSRSSVSVLMSEVLREISASEFASELETLRIESKNHSGNPRVQKFWLYQNLLPLYLEYRSRYPFGKREKKLLNLRIKGTSTKKCSEVMGISTRELPVLDRALLGIMIPKKQVKFPKTKPFAPFTKRQIDFFKNVPYRGSKSVKQAALKQRILF